MSCFNGEKEKTMPKDVHMNSQKDHYTGVLIISNTTFTKNEMDPLKCGINFRPNLKWQHKYLSKYRTFKQSSCLNL